MAARRRPERARFFPSGEAFRAWLEAHHARPEGLLVGLYRKQSGEGGLTYPEALDAALCFGWIDGPRKGLDARAYSIRFSPRREGSIWSRVNLRHVERLRAAGLMRPAGEAALARRDPARTGVYAFERPAAELAPGELAAFRAEAAAHRFFAAQPPGWRRTVLFWVVSAKRPETRAFRLRALIEHSARGERVSLLKPPAMTR
jgi:uncharacterized protein YdeI (YjbR/CyaY-like superfamily)